MKVFISQPMSGLSEERIMEDRRRAVEIIQTRHPDEPIEVIDNYKHNLPAGSHALEYLGRDIVMLKDADIVFFVEGHQNARGCRCEQFVANSYDLCIEFE